MNDYKEYGKLLAAKKEQKRSRKNHEIASWLTFRDYEYDFRFVKFDSLFP